MNDIDCPYCGKGQEVCHGDGHGYDEDEVFEQECSGCDKIFVYTTGISFYYDAEKAPCKNGDADHDWKEMVGYPEATFKGQQRCAVCDEQRDTMNPKDRSVAMEKYFAELGAQ